MEEKESTVHPHLSEWLGMKCQSSCSDKPNIQIREDDRFARKTTKKRSGGVEV